jgi:PiT family inorganic phosphate transporter
LASPFLALLLVLAILVARRLAAKRLGEAPDCFCIDVQRASLPASLVVDSSSLAVSQSTTQVDIAVGTAEACATERPLTFRITATHLHWFTSGATSFARGLNDTPKIVALVLVALALASGSSIGQSYAFATVALAMVAGSWMAGKKVTRVLAEEITPMDHQEGFIANLVTAGLVGPGAALGLPMSTTHVSTGAIIGVGTLKKAELNWKAVQSMLWAWVLTIPLAAVLGILAFTVLQVAQGNSLAW